MRRCRQRPIFKFAYYGRSLGWLKSGGVCLKASSRSRNARVIFARCTRHASTRWYGDRFGRIKNRWNNLCLTIRGGRRAPGTHIIMSPCTGRPHQKWFLTSQPGRAFRYRRRRRAKSWMPAVKRGFVVVWGRVRNAVNGRGVGGATVRFTGPTRATTRSHPSGWWGVRVRKGSYRVQITKSGFANSKSSLSVRTRRTKLRNDLVMSKRVGRGQFRFVLTWGPHPRDLDSHMKTPYRCHVAYYRKKCNKGRGRAQLDFDVTRGRGPETMTIKRLYGRGWYKYYVRQYSGDGNLRSSGATVTIYAYNKTYRFRVGRQGRLRGRYWYVAKVNGRTGAVSAYR